MQEELELHLIAKGDEEVEAYPVIWVQNREERNPTVRLHLPTENHWSDEISIDDAEQFIRRVEFILDHGLYVQVLDPNGLWPSHWQPLIKQ